MEKTKKDDLKLIPEKKFGELVTAITRVPKTEKAKAGKPKSKKRR
jgi:hypothetical protein